MTYQFRLSPSASNSVDLRTPFEHKSRYRTRCTHIRSTNSTIFDLDINVVVLKCLWLKLDEFKVMPFLGIVNAACAQADQHASCVLVIVDTYA